MQSIRTIEQLKECVASGARAKFVFFWGHTPSKDGSITKSCFSQWCEAPFLIDDICYRTAEHYMMASKARMFGDEETLQEILAADHPKQAKELGRKVRGFDDSQWVSRRFELVVTGNEAKFAQHRLLGDFLMQTGDRVLVEASPYDRIWGIGMPADDPLIETPSKWRGLNLLGFALMEVRERLARAKSAG